MRRIVYLLLIAVSPLGMPNVHSQALRVGPLGGVNVRLPFASVDTLPFGLGTRVNAPLASVNTGLYGLGRPFGAYGHRFGAYGHPLGGFGFGVFDPYPLGFVDPIPYAFVDPHRLVPLNPYVDLHPSGWEFDRGFGHNPYYGDFYSAVPTYSAIPRVPLAVAPLHSHRRLYHDGLGVAGGHRFADSHSGIGAGRPANPRETLAESATRLKRALQRRPDDAQIWLDYLKPDTLIQAAGSADLASVDGIVELSKNYEGVAGNPQLSSIWSADGFRQTHQALMSRLASSPSPEAAGADDAGTSDDVDNPDDAGTPDDAGDAKAESAKVAPTPL